jgi:pimeloyl-ACP methyl ester carboxylesterase
MIAIDDGLRFHCVCAGSGEPVFLLHGFPQTWHEWRHVLPELATRHSVVAVDLKGAGFSDKPAVGYDKVTMAGELDQLRQRLGFASVQVVGHDIGAMVAFAWAATCPQAVSKLVILDVPLPGVSIWQQLFADPRVWHFAFFGKRDLPELLIAGRERLFVEHFIRDRAYNQGGISDEDLDVFARAFAQPGAARGAFEWYRTFGKDVTDNLRYSADKIKTPVLALGGDQRWGPVLVGLISELAENVTGGSIRNCGHWIVEEQPRELLDALGRFLDS